MYRRSAAALLALLLALVPGSGPGALAQEPGDDGALRLRRGDAVRVEIGDEPELGGDYTVGPGGEVLLPLVGLVPVAGRPFPEVREAVRAAYARELRDAAVVVTPVLRVAVLGEVREPGLLPVDPSFTLADVLAAAGGLAPDAHPDRVDLVRAGRTTRLSLSAPDSLGMALRPGDQIVVGRLGWTSRNLPVLISAGASVVAAVLTSLILR